MNKEKVLGTILKLGFTKTVIEYTNIIEYNNYKKQVKSHYFLVSIIMIISAICLSAMIHSVSNGILIMYNPFLGTMPAYYKDVWWDVISGKEVFEKKVGFYDIKNGEGLIKVHNKNQFFNAYDNFENFVFIEYLDKPMYELPQSVKDAIDAKFQRGKIRAYCDNVGGVLFFLSIVAAGIMFYRYKKIDNPYTLARIYMNPKLKSKIFNKDLF